MAVERVRRLIVPIISVVVTVVSLTTAGAASANLSRSYKADSNILNGSIVSLDNGRSGYVLPANTSNSSRLIGVAVSVKDSLLAVDPGSGTVQVATSGTANTLVSDLNGTIKVGDQISASPFDGVGMKANTGSEVIGLAQAAFDGQGSGVQTQQVTDRQGKSREIKVGLIPLGIAAGSTTSEAVTENALQRLGRSITGHQVSTARVLVSLVVAIVAVISLVVLMYASIFGSIISIGRNPLAKFAVFRSLGSVMGMALLTAAVATVTIVILLH